MISLEKRCLIGEVETKLYSPDGLLKSFRKSKNITVNSGFRTICDMMGQISGQPIGFQYSAIGIGTVAPSASDTLLASEVARVLGGYTRTADTIWKNDATFGAGTGTGTITESGLFNNSTANSETMLCRQTFGAITKGAADTLVVTWQYTLS
jgi:hypothetical protein